MFDIECQAEPALNWMMIGTARRPHHLKDGSASTNRTGFFHSIEITRLAYSLENATVRRRR